MLDTLTNVVSILAVLSVSAERLVELVKGRFQWLNDKQPDPQEERKRQFWLHLGSVIAGCAVVFLAQDFIVGALPELKDKLLGPTGLGLGLLASGGSSLWNSVLSYLLSVKNLKRDEAGASAAGAVDQAAPLKPALPTEMPGLGLPKLR